MHQPDTNDTGPNAAEQALQKAMQRHQQGNLYEADLLNTQALARSW